MPPVISDRTQPAVDYVTVTPGAGNLALGVCRGIRCNEDGFLKLTNEEGTVRDNIPVFKGDNPLAAKVINTPGSGAAPSVVVALY